MSEKTASNGLWLLFFGSLCCSFALMYYHHIVVQNFTTFTDEVSVPEATDFIASLFGHEVAGEE